MFEPYIHWSELASNLAVTAVSVATPILGLFGFRSWRRELTGKTKYQSSHKILLVLYKIRDRIDVARNPFFDVAEYQGFSHDDKDVNLLNAGFRQEAYAYNRRLIPLRELYEELHMLSLEAEALWEDDVKQQFRDVEDQLNKLFIDARKYYSRERKDDHLESLYKIIIHHEDNDDYMVRLEKHIETIENYFKPYLK